MISHKSVWISQLPLLSLPESQHFKTMEVTGFLCFKILCIDELQSHRKQTNTLVIQMISFSVSFTFLVQHNISKVFLLKNTFLMAKAISVYSKEHRTIVLNSIQFSILMLNIHQNF